MLSKKSIGIACALALGVSGMASATAITVDGITWDPNAGSDLTIQSLNLRETEVGAVGDVLHGYGEIGSINGVDATTGNPLLPHFCTNNNCDLTFTFSYTVKSITGNQVVFDDGSFQFYVAPGGTFSFGDPTSADNGTPWLTLTGHTAPRTGFVDTGGQLYANVNGTINNPQVGSGGFGLVDATGGDAQPYMDSNFWPDGIGGFADFQLVSSFSVFPFTGCGSTPTTNLDFVCSYPIQGNGSLTGKSVPVPEPSALGLLGLGLGFLGLLVWRRRKEGDERA
ncbi:MAG TPA: PEP-CTERM sorting domain-containing protein [Rhodanobacteraceae bacterium]|nr:PEP-CTERM sorting domain-containing protein [Rhodanobacteraceae bacterium]